MGSDSRLRTSTDRIKKYVPIVINNNYGDYFPTLVHCYLLYKNHHKNKGNGGKYDIQPSLQRKFRPW